MRGPPVLDLGGCEHRKEHVMPDANRMAYLDAEHRITIRTEPIPRPGAGEALVKIAANGLCGSDIHFYHEGRLGNFVVTTPYVPGHEACGVVAGVGEGALGVAAGDRVVIEPGIPCGRCGPCRGGRYNLCPDVVFLSAPPINGTFCDYVAIRADALHAMPEGMDFEAAALAEPAAVAVHAVNRAGAVRGADAVVLGCGPIGLLTLQAFRAAGGARVVAVDKLARRLDKARQLGAAAAVEPGDEAALAEGGDVVFETAGSAAATAGAFRCARPGGTVVQVGWPEENLVPLNIAEFLDKELDYVAVNRYANAFPTAIAWLADGRLRADELITHRFGFDRVEEAFRFSLEHRDEVIKTVVLN